MLDSEYYVLYNIIYKIILYYALFVEFVKVKYK